MADRGASTALRLTRADQRERARRNELLPAVDLDHALAVDLGRMALGNDAQKRTKVRDYTMPR